MRRHSSVCERFEPRSQFISKSENDRPGERSAHDRTVLTVTGVFSACLHGGGGHQVVR